MVEEQVGVRHVSQVCKHWVSNPVPYVKIPGWRKPFPFCLLIPGFTLKRATWQKEDTLWILFHGASKWTTISSDVVNPSQSLGFKQQCADTGQKRAKLKLVQHEIEWFILTSVHEETPLPYCPATGRLWRTAEEKCHNWTPLQGVVEEKGMF